MSTPDIVAWAGSVSLVLIGWVITARAILHMGHRIEMLAERVAHMEGAAAVPRSSGETD